MSASDFNVLLLQISSKMNSDNLKDIKFLVREEIGKKKLEQISSGFQLFEVLIERGLLSADNREGLSGFLSNIGRNDLSELLTGSPRPPEPPADHLSPAEREKLNIASEFLSENLGKNWRKLGRKLKLKEAKMDSIAKKHQSDLEETVVELLKEWSKTQSPELKIDELIGALRDCDLNLTADDLEEELKKNGAL